MGVRLALTPSSPRGPGARAPGGPTPPVSIPRVLSELINELRARHCAIAATFVRAGDISVQIDPGADPVDELSLFEIGSITKTITGTLLAVLVQNDTVALETTVADVLGDVGPTGRATLRQLATHTAGLPRLAPNHAELQTDPENPYRNFDEAALLEALSRIAEFPPAPEPEYSNFGFQLLGHILATAGARPYGDLVVDGVLKPAGCAHPRCGEALPGDHRLPGYSGDRRTPRWAQPLAGAGGVELGTVDFGRWISANTFPATSEIDDAVRLAQEVHWGDGRQGQGLGWQHYNGGLIHNGGTGGFRTFCGFVPNLAGVGVMTNLGGWDAIDGAAIGALTRSVQEIAEQSSS